MKKWLAVLCFGIILLTSNSVLASSAYTVQKSTKIFSARSFNSSVLATLQPGDEAFVDNTNNINGWLYLTSGTLSDGSFAPNGYIAPDGAKVEINRVFEAFDSPGFGGAKYVFSPQTVIVRDGDPLGYLLIDTYAGPKWTGVNGIPFPMSDAFPAYDTPVSQNPVAWFAPQKVFVQQTAENGWSKISTYLGDKWIIRYPHEETINRNFCAYSDTNYALACHPFADQTVKVLKSNNDGWLQIFTWQGNLWVATQGSYVDAPSQFVAYSSPMGKVAGLFAPQRIFVLGESLNPVGYLKIRSNFGDVWVRISSLGLKAF